MKGLCLYFVYGSNPLPEEMQRQYTKAIPYEPAILPNYRLTERLYADVDYSPGDQVHGFVYIIRTQDIKHLDRYEGRGIYERHTVEVILKGGRKVPALVYEMTRIAKGYRNGTPYSDEYLQRCRIPNDSTKKDTTVIAAYGTLRSLEDHARFCRNAISRRIATIRGTLYDNVWYPFFVPKGRTRITVELIEIPLRDLAAIDRLEDYPNLFGRKLMNFTLQDGSTAQAWIYIMNQKPTDTRVIRSGDWTRRWA